jgi:hypothetical protein
VVAICANALFVMFPGHRRARALVSVLITIYALFDEAPADWALETALAAMVSVVVAAASKGLFGVYSACVMPALCGATCVHLVYMGVAAVPGACARDFAKMLIATSAFESSVAEAGLGFRLHRQIKRACAALVLAVFTMWLAWTNAVALYIDADYAHKLARMTLSAALEAHDGRAPVRPLAPGVLRVGFELTSILSALIYDNEAVLLIAVARLFLAWLLYVFGVLSFWDVGGCGIMWGLLLLNWERSDSK